MQFGATVTQTAEACSGRANAPSVHAKSSSLLVARSWLRRGVESLHASDDRCATSAKLIASEETK